MKSGVGSSQRHHQVYPARDGRLRRLAAKDILDQHIKFREFDVLTCRIEAIEERLEVSKQTPGKNLAIVHRMMTRPCLISVTKPGGRPFPWQSRRWPPEPPT